MVLYIKGGIKKEATIEEKVAHSNHSDRHPRREGEINRKLLT